MLDIDALVAEATTVGQLVAGAPPAVVKARAMGAPGTDHLIALYTSRSTSPTANRWSPGEKKRLAVLLAEKTLPEIADELGRSENAVKVKLQRLGLPAPSKQPDEWTATQIGRRMGMCGKSVARLIDRGIMPGRVATATANIRVVSRITFMRWVVNPLNWIYFKFGRIRDPHIRRLVERQQQRWPDAWWTPGQVAQYHGLPETNLVNKYILDGRLPASRWGNWWILRSDAVAVEFRTGKGSGTLLDVWNDEMDRFIVLARAVGFSMPFIDDMVGRRSTDSRMAYLEKHGRLPSLAAEVGAEYDGGALFADWRQHSSRFPGLARAVRRFEEERPLGRTDLLCLRGVLWSWAQWYGRDGDADLLDLAGRMQYATNASPDKLRDGRDLLREKGIEPFCQSRCSQNQLKLL